MPKNLCKKDNELEGKKNYIMEMNNLFFSSKPEYVEKLLEIIEGRSIISIRILEYFVVNYAKKYDIRYNIKINNNVHVFEVYNNFKNQLKGASKKYFDPFCRKNKLVYSYINEKTKQKISFESSVGQMTFFKWAIKNKVIQYVEDNIDKIQRDMKQTTDDNKKKKSESSSDTSPKVTKELGKIDRYICSSENIKPIIISDKKKESKSEQKPKRHKLSCAYYDKGIKISSGNTYISFD